MGIFRRCVVEREPAADLQVVCALGQRLDDQLAAVEACILALHAENKVWSNSSRQRKLGMMKSAPTLDRRFRFHSSTSRHSGSAVATPTATPPPSFMFSIST